MKTVTNQTLTNARTKPTQVKVSVEPEIAAAFKNACIASNVSMAAVLTQFMLDYSKGSIKSKAAPDYSTRRKRRAIAIRILNDLEQMKAAEESLLENAPENLQGAPIYETAEEYIEALEEAIEQLSVMVP